MDKNIIVVGLNHKIAPVEIREKIAFQENILKKALNKLNSYNSIDECIILSTCNRVEIYAVTCKKEDIVKNDILNFIAEFHNINIKDFLDYLYFYFNRDAVRHIFRVGASLDSMILGEPQILGQLKDAYRIATEERTTKNKS